VGGVVVAGCAVHDGSGGLSAAALARTVARDALRDAGLDAGRLTAAFIGTADSGGAEGPTAVGARVGLRSLDTGRETSRDAFGHPLAEHAAASGTEALHMACHAIRLEADDAVLCVGVDTAATRPWPDPAVVHRRALQARRVLGRLSASPNDLACVVVKNHRHGAERGLAQTISAEQVLASEALDWPLTRSMLAGTGAGAAAIVLTSSAAASRGAARPTVLASTVAAGDGDAVSSAAARAYREAGLGPEDTDCAEVHDVTAAVELDAYDRLGWVTGGPVAELVTSGFTALGGVLPVNPSGGLLSLGERPASAAIAQVASLALQLRGDGRRVQVPGARTALAYSCGRTGRAAGELVTITLLAR